MQNFSSNELAKRVDICVKALEETKAVDINVLNLEKKGLMAESLIVLNGTSNVHMQAIANKLSKQLKEDKIEHIIEGLNSDIWVLVDCGDVIIHIFSEEARDFYSLEKLWVDTEKTA